MRCEIIPVSSFLCNFVAGDTVGSECSNYEVRLEDGSNDREGRAEICFNQAWGTICNKEFGRIDAEQICSQARPSFSGE